ncbi:hypothetical protein ACOM2C_17130 [Pseudarthrobacter sp. So.54]
MKGFIATVRSIDLVREVHSEHGSAVLYDAEMPAAGSGLPSFSPSTAA